MNAAGALYSTVGDLDKWDRALYTDKLIDAGSRGKIFTPFKDGFGWEIGEILDQNCISHGGGINGFVTHISRFAGMPGDESSGSEIGRIAIKLRTDNIPGILSRIEEEWKAIEPKFPFEYSFLDDSFDRLYRSEQRMGRIFIIFTLLAWPVAYFAMHKWLQGFAYRIDLQVWMFLLSGLTALVVSLLTVGSKTIKAAASDPVRSIRCE